MTISLAFLAPDLVKAAIAGRLPHGMGVARLADMPAEWSRQHQMLGLPAAEPAFEPSLYLSRSPFPGNGISGPEKNAQKRPADCNDAVSENEPSHRSPPIRGLSYTFRKSPVARDCVVGPGVVPRHGDFNNLDCQTGLTGITGAKCIFRCCQISHAMNLC